MAQDEPRNRSVLGLACSYLFFFAAIGIIVPFLSPVLLSLGFARRDIGLIQAGMALCAMFSTVLVARLTDRWGSPDSTLKICSTLALGVSLLLWWQRGASHTLLTMIILLLTSVRSPMVPLQDTLAMQVAGGEPHAYARLRLVGSVGFMLAACLAGLAFGEGLRDRFFPTLVVIFALLVASSMMLPQARERWHVPGINVPFWSKLDRAWWLWIVAMTLHWFAFGPYHYGLTLFLSELNFPERTTGAVWGVAVGSELVGFVISPWVFARWSNRKVLFVALGSSVVRWTLLGVWPSQPMMWFTQLLHGAGFALFYAAAMQSIYLHCGGRMQASYQALFAACVTGLGAATGMATAGWLHERMPFAHVLLWMLVPQAAALLLLWLTPFNPTAESKS